MSPVLVTRVFRSPQNAKVSPDLITFNASLSACEKLQRWMQAVKKTTANIWEKEGVWFGEHVYVYIYLYTFGPQNHEK